MHTKYTYNSYKDMYIQHRYTHPHQLIRGRRRSSTFRNLHKVKRKKFTRTAKFILF